MTAAKQLELISVQTNAFAERAWRRGNLKYKMNPVQETIADQIRELQRNGVRYIAVECARGFGKSWLELMLAMEDCARPPNDYPVFLLGPSLKQTKGIVSPIFHRIAADAPDQFIRQLKAENQFLVGENHFELGGFDRGYIESLRGRRAKHVYIDEAGICDDAEFLYGIHDILLPMLSHSGGSIIMLTSTPRNLDHPFLTQVVPKAQLEGAHFIRTIDQNPTMTEEQKASLIRELGGRESLACRRELYCERVRPTDILVLPSFIAEKHVSEIESGEGAWILFGDYGGVQDKTALAAGYYDFPTATLKILDEAVFEPNTPTTSMLESIRRLLGHHHGEHKLTIALDAPGQILVDLKAHGIDASLPVKTDFDAQINQLEIAFQTNRILIHPRCSFLIASCEHGRFNKQRTDFERTPALGHCDGIAALMYGWRMVDKSPRSLPNYAQTYHARQETQSLKQVARAVAPKRVTWRGR